jgi:RHS repeat-associated protein
MGSTIFGRRKTLVDGTGTTTFGYDALGRTLTLTAPTSGSISYSYNGRGDRTALTYPDTSVVSYAYLGDQQLQSVTQGSTTLATYAYDRNGRLTQLARANGQVTNYGYDNADRLRQIRDLQGGTIPGRFEYQYNRLGQRSVITDTLPLSVSPSSTRIKSITFEAGSLTDATSGADSTVGSVLLEQSSPLKESYAARVNNTAATYVNEDVTATDEIDVSVYVRLTALPSANAEVLTIRNGSTTVGNLQLTTAGALRLRNGTTTIGADSAPLSLNTLYRVGLRQRKSTASNGILQAYLASGDAAFGSTFAQSTTQTFTTQVTQVQVGATTATAVNLTLDDLQLDTAALPGPSSWATTRTTSYAYDGVNRLSGATESPGSSYSYTYDAAGNRTDGSRTYDAANQQNGTTYDAAGNQTVGVSGSSATYDALSRPVSFTSGTQTTTVAYNGDGTLASSTSGGITAVFAQDLAAPQSQILRIVAAGTPANYLYGRERVMATFLGTQYWYVNDALNSVRRTVLNPGGAQGAISYDPWGLPQGGVSVPTFGFTGELQNDVTKYVYLRARWYTPNTGNFRSVDPFAGVAEQPYSLHPYAYAFSDPVLNTDPSGQCVPWAFKYAQYDPTGFGRILAQLAQGDCEFVFLQGQGLNWADGQSYAQSISEPVVQAAQGFSALMTNPEVQQAFVARYTGPLGAIRFGGDMVIGLAQQLYATGVDLATGANCHDPNQYGRGLSRIALALGNVVATKLAVKAISGFNAGGVAPPQTSLSILQRLAQQADQTTPIPPGTNATVAGTLKHTTFARLVRALQRTDLTTEVNYLNGNVLVNNARGSVRLDVVEGPLTSPTAVYDLKTGVAGLTPQRITQIRTHLPNNGIMPNGQPIPVIELRP